MDNGTFAEFYVGDYVYVSLLGDFTHGDIIGIRPGNDGQWLYTVNCGDFHVSVYGKQLSYTL